jgi:uridine phosphorylase
MRDRKESEIVLNEDGSVYHLHLKNEHIADWVILVGDPGRVKMISDCFEKTEYTISNREFTTHTGYYKGKRITVLSSGIGTDNIDIVVNELHIAVNYRPETNQFENRRKLNLIRLGTSGGLQEDLTLGGFILSEYAIGLDSLFNWYADNKSICETDLLTQFLRSAGWPTQLPEPYFVKCSIQLALGFSDVEHKGITATSPGFYGPQGRYAALQPAFPNINEKLSNFEYGKLKILNYEMETSALYALGRSLGHQTLTICVLIANRSKGEFLSEYKQRVKDLINYTLEKIAND